MLKLIFVFVALAVGLDAHAADAEGKSVVDLRDTRAWEQLQQDNPNHYERVRQAVEALTAQPQLAEGDWLQVNVNARDVDLSRYVIRTSYPPKQLLQFTIDETRYVMHLVRSDMAARAIPAQ